MKQIKYEFPIEQTLPSAFLKENFWKCNYTSVEKGLQYSVILPNNVKPVNIQAIVNESLRLTTIGQYSRIDDSPFLEVDAAYEHISYEMNPADWLMKKLALMGETVVNAREIIGKSTGIYIDVLTSKKWDSGDEIISRFTVLKDSGPEKRGGNIFCLKASCLADSYSSLSDIIFQIVSNWELINLSNWQMAESLFPFNYDFAELVSFYVPDSWEIEFEVENTKEFSRFVFIHDVLGENKGIITSHFYALPKAQDAAELLKKSFDRLLQFKPELSSMSLVSSSNPNIDELWSATGKISYDETREPAFLNIHIIKTLAGWYYFELVGPNPNIENDYWEINKRTQEIIIDSFNNMDFTKIEKIEIGPDGTKKNNVKDAEIRRGWLSNDWNSN